MPTASVNGITINYLLEGEGPETVVLVNGLADELETWDYQVPALLEAGYRVLRFDNRGVGRTSVPEGPYTPRLLADDAKALVDHLGLTDFQLMGTSMGGMIAQEYALAYGSDLRSLILSCTNAAPGPYSLRMFRLWEELAPTFGVPFIMRDVTLRAFTVPFFTGRPEDLAEFEQAMADMKMSVEAYLAQLNVIITHDTRDRLGAVTVPTLVQAGEEDTIIPVSASRELHALVPGAEWCTTRGGHACLWEFPEEFNAALLDFLGRQRRNAG
ncbi:alpha/beta fold hydrolase [Streptomyces sp. NPDC002758]